MDALAISLLFTLGAATWVYTKLQSRNGYDGRRLLITTAAAAVVIFAVLSITLSIIF